MLIECLHKKEITFFWHADCNLIGHFDPSTLDNMENRLKRLKRKLEMGLDKTQPNYSLADAVNDVFTKRSGSSSLSQPEEVYVPSSLSYCGDTLEYQTTYTPTQNIQKSQYRPISEDFYSSESSQETSSTSWGDIATGEK
ncbi:hypothetical protein C0J52_25260 [Blattella germanica]|nr:hypothetical protein C0J52_25260 [Blattella germanica]